MTANTIYVLEDDPALAQIYDRELRAAGFDVHIFDTIQRYVDALAGPPPALSVLDLGLPDGDALSVIRNVLETKHSLTIVASGRGGLGDKLVALESGADDYIVKPFEPAELIARIKSVLRRSSSLPEGGGGSVAHFDGLAVNFDTCELTLPDGQTTSLSYEDVRMLSILIRARGRVLSRDYLLSALRSQGDEVFDRSIDVRISRLRKKLKAGSENDIIRTVYGAGYVFVPQVAFRP